MRKFNFDPAQYTTADGKPDFTKFMEDHKKFVEGKFTGYVSQEDHAKVLEELKPLKATARQAVINKAVNGLTDADKIQDAIDLAKLSDEDDEASIKTKVSEVIKARKYLQKTVEVPPEAKDGEETKTDPSTNKLPDGTPIIKI